MPEFVNPKYKDASRTAFKSPTRLECMMQDFPWLMPPDAAVSFTLLDASLFYCPVKNALADAAKKAAAGQSPSSASAGEFALYALSARLLELAGATVERPPPSPSPACRCRRRRDAARTVDAPHLLRRRRRPRRRRCDPGTSRRARRCCSTARRSASTPSTSTAPSSSAPSTAPASPSAASASPTPAGGWSRSPPTPSSTPRRPRSSGSAATDGSPTNSARSTSTSREYVVDDGSAVVIEWRGGRVGCKCPFGRFRGGCASLLRAHERGGAQRRRRPRAGRACGRRRAPRGDVRLEATLDDDGGDDDAPAPG